MRTINITAFLLAACWGAVAFPAHADFRVLGADKPPAAVVPPAGEPATVATASKAGYRPIDGSEVSPAAAATTKPSSSGFGLVAVSYVGTPATTIDVRKGMGRNVRLADALRQIAPVGWRGYGRADVADTFDPNKLVSWKGGRPWTEVLDILANEQDLAIEIDWNRRHLYVGKREFAAPPAVVAAERKASPAQSVPIVPVWSAKPGNTVRGTVEEWAKRGGWTVVWPMNDLDYRIVAPLSFDGSLVDATSKLTRLYEAAERPLAADIHVNQKLIVFSEKGAAAP